MNKSEIAERARKRFEFEKYAKTVTWNTYAGDDDPFAFFPESGVYANGDIQFAWLGWQWRERAIAESQAWIPVEEKLPPTGELLIARIAYRSLGHPTEETIVCMVDGEGGGDLVSEVGDDIGWTDEVITHWRLADSPPKGNENV